MRRLASIALALGLCARHAAAQRIPVATPADSARWRALVARIVAGDTLADFTELRMLSVRMTPMQVGGSTPAEHFRRARATTDSLVARVEIDSVLNVYFGSAQAHRDAAALFAERGDSTRYRAESAIVRAFVASIGENGGTTASTAMPVVSVAEERVFLEASGVHPTLQALATCRDGPCDVITGTDERTGKQVMYYFLLTWMTPRIAPER